MKLTMLDTKTLAKLDFEDGGDAYWWAEGNGSCDCNRATRMLGGEAVENEILSKACVSERFLIVACDDPGYTLAEMNDGYPKELLAKHGIT